MSCIKWFVLLHLFINAVVGVKFPIECVRCSYKDINCRDTIDTVSTLNGRWGHRAAKGTEEYAALDSYYKYRCANPVNNTWCVKIKIFTGLSNYRDQRVRRDCWDKLPPGVDQDTCVYRKELLEGVLHPALFCSCRDSDFCNSTPPQLTSKLLLSAISLFATIVFGQTLQLS